jgi:hypothetical protein
VLDDLYRPVVRPTGGVRVGDGRAPREVALDRPEAGVAYDVTRAVERAAADVRTHDDLVSELEAAEQRLELVVPAGFACEHTQEQIQLGLRARASRRAARGRAVSAASGHRVSSGVVLKSLKCRPRRAK